MATETLARPTFVLLRESPKARVTASVARYIARFDVEATVVVRVNEVDGTDAIARGN